MASEIEEVERLPDRLPDDDSSMMNDSVLLGPNNPKREKLSSLAYSGLIKEYTGKLLSQDQIEKLDDDAVDKLYAKYEETLGKKCQSLSPTV